MKFERLCRHLEQERGAVENRAVGAVCSRYNKEIGMSAALDVGRSSLTWHHSMRCVRST